LVKYSKKFIQLLLVGLFAVVLGVSFSFLGFAGVCRIPMTLFEVSFLGLKFTLIRLAIAITLMLLTGITLGSFLEKRGYQIQE